jgi:hypothetical protein
MARYRRVRYPALAAAIFGMFIAIAIIPRGREGAGLPARVLITSALFLPLAAMMYAGFLRQEVRVLAGYLEIVTGFRYGYGEDEDRHRIDWSEIDGFSVVQPERWPSRRRCLVVHRHVGPVTEHRKIDRVDAWTYLGRCWTDRVATALEQYRRATTADPRGHA